MIHFQAKHFVLTAAVVAALGIAGCNLFNPTQQVNIESGDANALTYEGYIKFRNNEYTEASNYFSKAIEADSTPRPGTALRSARSTYRTLTHSNC